MTIIGEAVAVIVIITVAGAAPSIKSLLVKSARLSMPYPISAVLTLLPYVV